MYEENHGKWGKKVEMYREWGGGTIDSGIFPLLLAFFPCQKKANRVGSGGALVGSLCKMLCHFCPFLFLDAWDGKE